MNLEWMNLKSLDLMIAAAMLAACAAIALAYSARVYFRGRAQFARVEQHGGSALLAKEVAEAAYWSLQPLGRLLVFCGVTPNQLTWTSVVLAILAGACMAAGHFGFGAAFSAISSLLDALDGMVARMTGSVTKGGEVLDSSIDRYSEFFFLGGLALHYRQIPVLLALVLLAMIGSFMVSYSTAKAEALQVKPPKGSMRRPERALYLALGAGLSPVTIPWLEHSRTYPVAVGHPMVMALLLVAVMANLSAVERLLAVARAAQSASAIKKTKS